MDRRKRVLFVTDKLQSGGAETHIIALSEGLRKRGYEITVVSSGGKAADTLSEKGFYHLRLPTDSKNPISVLRCIIGLTLLVRRRSVGTVHSHSRTSSFSARIAAVFAGALFFTTAHLDFPADALRKKLTFWGDKTLAVSDDIRDHLIEVYGVDYNNITVTVNGIDTKWFSPDGGENKRKLVHVSRIDTGRAKTAFLLAEASTEIYNRFGLTTVIVGGGDLLPALCDKCDSVNIAAGLKVVTAIGETTDVREHLRGARIFVGVSRAALEAMSCGIPTVLSGDQGFLGTYSPFIHRKAAKTNFCCRGADAPDITALMHSIEKLATDDTVHGIASHDCRKCVLRYYAIDKMLDDYERLFRRFAERTYSAADIAILGYHGFGNCGDDAVLEKMLAVLLDKASDCSVTVLSKTPAATAKKYGVYSVGRYNYFAVKKVFSRSDILIIGGGTLFQTRTSRRSMYYYLNAAKLARALGAKLFFWSNGFQSDNRSFSDALCFLMKDAFVVARDIHSFLNVLPFCGNARLGLAADSAFLIDEDTQRAEMLLSDEGITPGSYVAVSTVGCCHERVADVCRDICEYGYRIVVCNMFPSKDTKYSEKLAALYGAVVINGSARELAAVFASAIFAVCARYHALLFAAKAGVPFINLSTDEKCVDFTEDALGARYPFLCSRHPSQDRYRVKFMISHAEEISLYLRENAEKKRRSAEKMVGYATRFLEMTVAEKQKQTTIIL